MLWSLLLIALAASTNGFRIVCYYTNWAQYRPGKGQFLPESVNPRLCTHISYAFSNLQELQLKTFEWNDEVMIPRVVALKKINPNVKILLAVGGDTVGSTPFIFIVKSEANRKTFADNVVKYIRERHFDGFEMDWEFPTRHGSSLGDKLNFILLMEELKSAFVNDASIRGVTRLELGVAVGAGKQLIDTAYDVPRLANAADFINVMAYDYHGGWESTVGFNSPLFAFTGEQGVARYLNVNWTIHYFASLGAPKDKINVGIASYGRSFTLANPTEHAILSQSTGPGLASPFVRLEGYMAYFEVCDFIVAGGKVTRVDSQKNPYVVKGDQWIGYDDVQSVKDKACFAKQQGFGGIIFWTLDFDDFNGSSCKQGAYPLLTAIYNAWQPASNDGCIGSFVFGATTATVPSTTTTTVTSTTSPRQYLGNFRVNCYYMNSAQYTPLKGAFNPENIDPNLCTHITYAFVNIEGEDILISEWNDVEMFERVLRLKQNNTHLKVLLAVGNENNYPPSFRPLLDSLSSQKTFTKNVVTKLRNWKFDGFALSWNNPLTIEITYEDKPKFTSLIMELKKGFDEDEKASGQPKLLLSVLAPANKTVIDTGYDIANLARYVDFFDVLTFEFHDSVEQKVGFNSPLYASAREKGAERNLNVDWVAKYYALLGAPKKKINLAVAAYGKTFVLLDPNQHDILSPSVGPGPYGTYTRQRGIFSYYEVCDFLKQGAEVINETCQGNPYAIKDSVWIGYDDGDSITEKIIYMKKNGYGGMVFWTLSLDDFPGTSCDKGKYPLLNAVLNSRFTASAGAIDTYDHSVEGNIYIAILFVGLVLVPLTSSSF